MATPTITKVSPLTAIRGATGTDITITGTNFGATGTGVTIGGVTTIPKTWSATSIVVEADDSPATPLGAQNIIVTTTSDGAVTKEKAVMVIDPTETFSSTQEIVDLISKVYVDGLHVGYLDEAITITPGFTTEDVPCNSLLYPVTTNVIGATMTVALTLIQANGANLALVSGGAWDSVGKLLTFTGTPTIPVHSIVVTEKSGNQYSIPNCQLINPSPIVLGGKTHKKFSVTFRALPISDDTSNVMVIYWPA